MPTTDTTSQRKLNPAQEVELQRLIAEQAADDTIYVSQGGARSLDAPAITDGDSFYEFVEDRELPSGPARSAPKQSYKITQEQVKEWRALRTKDHWTYAQIAEYAGVKDITVRRHLSDQRRMDHRRVKLEARLEDAREAYEAGAFLREIAEVLYEECGYASWQSCYQALLRLFRRHGIQTRPQRVSRRGRPKPGASFEEWQRFWRAANTRQRDRRRAAREQCDATTKAGRPCRRSAMEGGRFCVSHDERTKRKAKWTRDNVLAALRAWAEEHGRTPRQEDWFHASPAHPNFKTVADLFGGWRLALYEAGFLQRKPRRHGTLTNYKVHGCRCVACTRANAEYQRQYRVNAARSEAA